MVISRVAGSAASSSTPFSASTAARTAATSARVRIFGTTQICVSTRLLSPFARHAAVAARLPRSDQAEVRVDLALVRVDRDRLDFVEGHRPSQLSGLEERVYERGIPPPHEPINLRRATGLDALGELVVLGGQDLRVNLDKGKVVGPDPLPAEQLGRQRAQAVARRVVEDALVSDLPVPVEVEPQGAAMAQANTAPQAV